MIQVSVPYARITVPMTRSSTPVPPPPKLSGSQKTRSKSADGPQTTLPFVEEPRQDKAISRISLFLHYIFAVAAVVLALLVTLQIELLATKTPFALFFAAVVVSAWYGGRNLGWLAIALSTVLSDYFVIPPYSFIPEDSAGSSYKYNERLERS
jgi:hypothetical protein